MVTLELYTDYKSIDFNWNTKLSYFLLAYILVFFLSFNYIPFERWQLGIFLLIFFMVILFFLNIRGFFSKYEHSKGQKKKLVLIETHVEWDGNKIEWKQVIDFNINYIEIENKQGWHSGPKNNVSDGFNAIYIKSIDGQEFRGHYLLDSPQKEIIIKDLLLKSVFANQLDYNVAKKIVQPKNYKEHQELKQKLNESSLGST
jgi:hypothetical protein